MEGPTSRHNAAQPGHVDFLWIEDDGLLRDEGVVFGLASDGAGLQEKQECIHAYYRKCAAETERRREGLRQDLRMVEAEIATYPAIGVEMAPTAASGSSHVALVGRYATGILAAGVACTASGVLAFEQLQPEFSQAGLVTVGVVAAGLFTAFLPVSLLFENDRNPRAGNVELWKVRLADFGLPLVSAAFIAVWGWERLGPGRALSSFAFFLLVFTFVGRLLLSSIPRFGEAVGAVREERSRRREFTAARERATQDASARRTLTERTGALHRELATLRSPEEWEAICAAKLALFRSEFELALASRTPAARPTSGSAPSAFASL